MKVLIVEDEIFAALHLETAIQELGCEVIGIAPDSEIGTRAGRNRS